MKGLQEKLKTLLEQPKRLTERFLGVLCRYYITKYKERLKNGIDPTEEEDLLFAYAVQCYNTKGE